MKHTIKAFLILLVVISLISCNNLLTNLTETDVSEANAGPGNTLVITLPFSSESARSVAQSEIGSYLVRIATTNVQRSEDYHSYEKTVTPDNPTAAFTDVPSGTYEVSVMGYQRNAGPSGLKLIIASGYTGGVAVTPTQTATAEVNMELCCEWCFYIGTDPEEEPEKWQSTLWRYDEHINTGTYISGYNRWLNQDRSIIEKDDKTLYLVGWTKNTQYPALTAETYDTVMAQLENDGATVYQVLGTESVTEPCVFYSLYCENTTAHPISTITFKNLYEPDLYELSVYCLAEKTTYRLPGYDKVFVASDYHSGGRNAWIKSGTGPTDGYARSAGSTITLSNYYTDATNKVAVLYAAEERPVVIFNANSDSDEWATHQQYTEYGYFASTTVTGTLNLKEAFDDDYTAWLFNSDESAAGYNSLKGNPHGHFKEWSWSDEDAFDNDVVSYSYSSRPTATAVWDTWGTKAWNGTPAIGDIVFNDGSMTPYSAGLTLTQDQKDNAIGVIFYIGNQLNDPGMIDERCLIAGLKVSNSMTWCTDNPPSKDLNIQTMQTYIEYAGGELDGFGNHLNGMYSLDKLVSAIRGTDGNGSIETSAVLAKHPAFNYAANYSQSATNLESYDTCWYLPTIAEVYKLYQSGTTFYSAYNMVKDSSVYPGNINAQSGPNLWTSSTVYIEEEGNYSRFLSWGAADMFGKAPREGTTYFTLPIFDLFAFNKSQGYSD